MEKTQYLYFVSFAYEQGGASHFNNAMIGFEEKLDMMNAIYAAQAQVLYQLNHTVPHTDENPISITLLIPPVFVGENKYDPDKKVAMTPEQAEAIKNIQERAAQKPQLDNAPEGSQAGQPDNIVQI